MEYFIISANIMAIITVLVSLYYGYRIYNIVKVDTIELPLIKGMLNGIPMINMFNKGTSCNFIVDSGCDTSMLSMKAFERLHIEKEWDAPDVVLHGLGGDVTNFKKCVMILEDKYENDYKVTFDVSEHFDKLTKDADINGLVIDGILGSDFLQRFSWTIDFDKLVIYKKI